MSQRDMMLTMDFCNENNDSDFFSASQDDYDSIHISAIFREIEEQRLDDQVTDNTLNDCKTKKNSKFIVITPRMTMNDAILKKINKFFYHFVIEKLNKLIKKETNSNMKFQKVSNKLIKTVNRKKVKINLEKSLKEILEEDMGSKKYQTPDLNKKHIAKLLKVKNQVTDFVNKKLIDIFDEYQEATSITLSGPSYYIAKYERLKQRYIEHFYG